MSGLADHMLELDFLISTVNSIFQFNRESHFQEHTQFTNSKFIFEGLCTHEESMDRIAGFINDAHAETKVS